MLLFQFRDSIYDEEGNFLYRIPTWRWRVYLLQKSNEPPAFFVVAFIKRRFFIQILNKLNKFIPIHFSITFCFYMVKMRKQKSNQNVEYKAIRKELICDISALRSYLLPCINSIEGFFHFHCIVKCSINC